MLDMVLIAIGIVGAVASILFKITSLVRQRSRRRKVMRLRLVPLSPANESGGAAPPSDQQGRRKTG